MKVTTLTPKPKEPRTSYQANMQNSQNTSKRQFKAEVVSEKQWLRKNGQVVTQATRYLLENIAKYYSKILPTADSRSKGLEQGHQGCLHERLSKIGFRLG